MGGVPPADTVAAGRQRPSCLSMRDSLIAARDRLLSASGWRRRGLAVLFGGLTAAALPPVHLVFLLVPAFVGWLWLIDGTRGWRGALAVGWWFGVGHFAAGLYWISGALLVQPELFAWLIPFAVAGFSGGLAVFPAAVAAAVRSIPRRGAARIIMFALAWTAAEWLRGSIFTGLPWNLMGTVWVFSDAMIQSAALFGTYGLGLATVGIAALPAMLGDPSVSGRRAMAAVIGGLAALVLAWAGGAVRLAGADSSEVSGVRLRLVQPNIPQKLKWHRDHRDRNLATQVALSRKPVPGGTVPTHVIWAETAATFFVAQDPQRRAFLAQAAPPGGLVITGAPRSTPRGQSPYRVWNSLQAVDGTARIVGTYDKAHLVPFGEYVPFRPLLTIPKITEGRQDFSAGAGPVTLTLPGLPPVSPLICYEVIFPGAVVRRDDRPGWMLNLTNDAWYGRSSGPYQHLAAARMRAVEEGLPLVRVAATGISAVFDAHGRTVARLGLMETGILDSPLPAAGQPTPYARYGNWSLLVMAGMLALALFVSVAKEYPK